MELSEFVLTHVVGKDPLTWEYFADVTVTTRQFFSKKVQRRKIHREFAGGWHFMDNGEWCFAEPLERAYKARETLKKAILETQ